MNNYKKKYLKYKLKYLQFKKKLEGGGGAFQKINDLYYTIYKKELIEEQIDIIYKKLNNLTFDHFKKWLLNFLTPEKYKMHKYKVLDNEQYKDLTEEQIDDIKDKYFSTYRKELTDVHIEKIVQLYKVFEFQEFYAELESYTMFNIINLESQIDNI